MISRIERQQSRVRWRHDERGVAAIEAAMTMPVLVVLLLGVIDAGDALLINKKTMTAAQIVGDLVTRARVVTDAQIDDSIAAARMALQPYGTGSLGVDIASIEFRGINAVPTVIWRETHNMNPNPDVEEIASGLGVQGEGVVVVTTRYDFEPIFVHGMIGDVPMEEVAVTRGRRGPLVTRED